jgi:hypothetical protein
LLFSSDYNIYQNDRERRLDTVHREFRPTLEEGSFFERTSPSGWSFMEMNYVQNNTATYPDEVAYYNYTIAKACLSNPDKIRR